LANAVEKTEDTKKQKRGSMGSEKQGKPVNMVERRDCSEGTSKRIGG